MPLARSAGRKSVTVDPSSTSKETKLLEAEETEAQ
jgi:hypothetical protein